VPRRRDRQDLAPLEGDIRTTLARARAADQLLEEPHSTAEQAVPWLIGLILLLAGMVIVLLALIFAGDSSLGATGQRPTDSAFGGLPSPSGGTGGTTPTVAPSTSAAPSSSIGPTATPVPPPQYGPLDVVYQGRAAALAPIYLLRHDFTTQADPVVLAQDPNLNIQRIAWAPDGTVGAGLYADLLLAIEQGADKRNLGDGISAITFGDDASMLYAVRITADGANDVATILVINYVTGDTSELASIPYVRPTLGTETALKEAQFSDDGGSVRLYWLDDNDLLLWVLGGGTWRVTPGTGTVTDAPEALPLLWSPDGRHRIDVTVDGTTTTLRMTNASGDDLGTTTVEGLVSHLRWSRDGERLIFTLGRSASEGGVLQDLYLWDVNVGTAPRQITSTGAAFGAEWLGTTARWKAG
jgi:hypothetical protein